jgi:hypothetical protein
LLFFCLCFTTISELAELRIKISQLQAKIEATNKEVCYRSLALFLFPFLMLKIEQGGLFSLLLAFGFRGNVSRNTEDS